MTPPLIDRDDSLDRERRPLAWMADLWRDVRYAIRGLRRHPLFAVAAIGTLALGLGVNTAVFSLVHRFLIAALPVHDPARLVVLVRNHVEQGPSTQFPYALFKRLEAEDAIFDGVLSRARGTERVTMATEAGGEPALGELVSGSYFEVLGVRPHLGRLLTPADDVTPGAHAVVVLSHRYWQRRFGSDPSVIGRRIWLTASPMTVIGVSPPGFDGLDPGQTVDLRVPLAMQAEVRRGPGPVSLSRPTAWELNIVGRLKPGVSLDHARHVVEAALVRYLDEYEPAAATRSRSGAPERVELLPGATGFGNTRHQFQTPLVVVMALSVALLMIVCLNVANLLLAKASTRSHEFAVRRAIGAGSGRLFRQLLTESLVLAVAGGTLGLLVAPSASVVLLRLMSSDAGGSMPAIDLTPHAPIVIFHVTAALVAACGFGLAPAWTSRHANLGGRADTGRATRRGWEALIGVQVACSVLVLVIAALFLRTSHALRTTDPGFRADHLLALSLSPKNAGLADEQVLPFFRAVRERVTATPGVTGATYGMVRVTSNAAWRTGVTIEGRDAGSDAAAGDAVLPARDAVGPRYFETLGVPLIAGRDFAPTDGVQGPRVAIVNESFVRRYLRGRDPLGVKIGAARAEHTIVGVARDSKYASLREPIPPVWYVPYEQHPGVKYLNLYVRTAASPDAMTSTVRAAIASIDKQVALFEVRSQDAQIAELMRAERMVAVLAAFFGATAAGLAALGLYGVLACFVTQRRREIGIRLALGAPPRRVWRLVVGDASRWVGAGIVVGLAAAVALGRHVASLLYGVEPFDAFSLMAAAIAMAAVAVLAAAVPARRATRIDPVRALRSVQ